MSRRRPPRSSLRTRAVRVAIGTSLLLAVGSLAPWSTATAAAPQGVAAAPVGLGSAAGFSALAGPSITNTGAGTVLALDLGVTGTLAGFPPGTVRGETHVATTVVEDAHGDRQAAYDAAAAQTGGTPFAGDQIGKTYTPGLYTAAAAISNTGTMTLDADGDPSAVFVFQIGAALSSAASTKVVLANGALANNVYWQVLGAVALGADAEFVGTVLATGAVSFGEGASLKGRALTPSTLALANSPITQPIDDLVAPTVTINGGPTRSTNDTTPSISGTTDEPGTPLVTVTVGAQVLTARAASGAWIVSAGALAPGSHDVVASVTDPSGNTGSASQVLTVDTSSPVVTINGGPTAATNDTTPTISGTTDQPGTPTVTVSLAGQSLTTTADVDGAWTVDAGVLSETSHNVVASVVDEAGNTGSDSQVLTVDITVPVLTIDGGATRSTSDTSPWIYGTTAEQAGTIVHVGVGGQSLTATVQPGGTWGVSAQALEPGTYTVVATITDAAQNTGSMTQSLQIGTVAAPPVVPPAPPVTPPAAATYRPDAAIRKAGGSFVGVNSYRDSGQRVASTLRARGKSVTFEVRLTNRGDAADKMTVLGTPTKAGFAVAYLAGGRNVTAAVLDGSYRTGELKPGGSATLTVRVTRLKGAKPGSRRTFEIRVASTHDKQVKDTVAAVVKAGGSA